MERNEHEPSLFIFGAAVALGLLSAALGFYWALPVIFIGAVLIDFTRRQ